MVSISYVDDHDAGYADDYRVRIGFGNINMAGRTVRFCGCIFYFPFDLKWIHGLLAEIF
jgi:hypothetical protein